MIKYQPVSFRIFFDWIVDFLYFCFYPQEDKRRLESHRNQLTPFLKSVMQALNFELDNDDTHKHTEKRKINILLEEIIREARSLSTTYTHILTYNLQTLNTLQLEHNQLALNFE